MKFLESIDIDFRDIILLDREVYKRPLIPSALWKSLLNSNVELWQHILKYYRVEFEYEATDDPAHTCLGEFDEDRQMSSIKALVSANDTHHNLIFQVIQAVMHEYIHASQAFCNSEKFNDVPADDDSFEAYLSEWREVQAMAHCAFLEIMEYTDRPTRTMDYYQAVPAKVRRSFYRYIMRWAGKYGVTLKLTG